VKKNLKLAIISIAIVVVCVILDQVLKLWVVRNMQLGEMRPLLGEWFNLHYVQNKGMAFGMSWGDNFGKLALSLLRIGVVGYLIYYLWKKLKQNTINASMVVILSLIVAGAIGNIIDSAFYGMALGVGDPRFMYGSVVDMIYVKLFMMPDWVPGFGGEYFFPAIFNFADACVTVGIFAMLIFYKQFFKDEKKKEEPSIEEKTPEASLPADQSVQQN
jgi:signal peptidase II